MTGTISPKLFTAPLGNIFRRLTWETRDGEYLSNLHFADHTLIYANTPHELQQMLHESENQSLKTNKSKTKLMMKTDTPIYVNNTNIENVEIYLDRDIAPEAKTKTRRFKEESRLNGQHSPSTATSSRITLEHA